jgi:uncharacterized protein
MNSQTLGVLVGLLCLIFAVSTRAEPTATCRTHGQAALIAWTQGNDAAAVKNFSPGIAAQVTPEKLKEGWAQLQGVAGSFQKLGDLQQRTIASHALFAANMDFAHTSFTALIDCDAQGRITTFRIVPADASSRAQTSAPESATGIASIVQVASPLGPLPGTLVLPKGDGPFPAVVMIVGSGAHDRDETVGPNKAFRDLADGLAAAGVASLRYDKRTYAYATKMMGRDVTVDDEVTDDAVTALQLLAKQPHIDPRRVFILGHSLGAFMAPRIGQRDPQLAGIIMMAAPPSLGLDTIIKQMRYQASLSGMPAAQIDQKLAPLIKQRDILAHADPAHPPAGNFFGAPAGYWLSVRDYDPVATAKHLREPMLLLQGGSDIQVFPQQDFVAWQAAFAHDPRVTLIEYPGLSHMFMPASQPPSPDDDYKPGHVDAKVIQDIASWIKAQPGHS